MKSAFTTFTLLATLVGCATDEGLSTFETSKDGESRVLSVALSAAGFGLSATAFTLEPTGATTAFTCDGVPTNFHFVPVDTGSGTWTFTGSVPYDCTSPTVVNLKFTRADQPAAGARTVPEGVGYVRDPLGGASYKLDGAVLTVDYWGDSGTDSMAVTVDHDLRFSSHSFAFSPGHSCPGGQTGTLDLSATLDRFTIVMPHDVLNVPSSMTGSGDAGFLGPATDNGATIEYLFTFEDLAPDTNNDYTVTVTTSWPDPPNPDAFCGGTLTFRLEKRHFSLTGD